MPEEPAQLLSVTQVAKILGIAKRTARERIEARVIPGFKLIGANGRPSEWRVSVSGLNEYLRKCGAVTDVVSPRKSREPPEHLLQEERRAVEARLASKRLARSVRHESRRTPSPC